MQHRELDSVSCKTIIKKKQKTQPLYKMLPPPQPPAEPLHYISSSTFIYQHDGRSHTCQSNSSPQHKHIRMET